MPSEQDIWPEVGGVIKCLEHKGYHVRKVLASYSEDSDISRSVRSYRSTIYENDSIRFGAVFPGQPQEVHRLFDGDDLLPRLIYRDLGQGNTYEVEVYLRKDDLPLDQLAKMHIPSPRESTIEKIVLENFSIFEKSTLDRAHDLKEPPE